MRKFQLSAMNKALKDYNDILKKERDEARSALSEGIDGLRAALRSLGSDLAIVRDQAEVHTAALAKHGEDLAGLADSVRASLLAHAEDKAETPSAPTPIASKRNGKAVG